MTPERREFIYSRLLEIDIKVEVLGIPDPRYLNEKIGACHVLIEEVERYSIETYREMSVLQQAVNNAIADYETKRETLLSQDAEIRSLPNIKDREARVNAGLRIEQGVIRKYKNDVLALEHLLKALNLKAKNLNSKSGDIKSHIKIMESQVKLNSTCGSDPAVRSLMDEFKKSTINKDSFENVMGTVTESDSTDPSSPVDINNLLNQGDDGEDLPRLPVPEALLNPDPVLDPENNGESIEEDSGPEILDDVELDDTSTEEIIPETNSSVIDLDQIIDLDDKPKGGETPKADGVKGVKGSCSGSFVNTPKIIPEPEKPKVSQVKKQAASEIKPDPVITKKETTISSGLDLDDLLDSLQTKKGA